ncbi:MAG TPA: hypothetical protein VJ830_04190 [Anaerolineales bacterium]|nr:hypothetical protein [Anaerolineales bacterium]
MDNQPALDRTLLIPIFLSGCSVIGIVLVLLIGRSLNSPAEVPVTPSATRFQYVYLGTEPAITTPLGGETEIEPTDDPFEEPGEEPTEEDPGFPVTQLASTPTVFRTPTRPGASTPIVLTLPNATNTSPATVTSASVSPLTPGTYDDGHQYIIYDGWQATGAVHVSFEPGSTITFRFIGRQLRLIYQGGLTLGQLRINIDTNISETLDESSGNEWASELLVSGTHTVLITHTGGGSVNLDQVIIPDIPNTPTPTRTPTP